MRGFCHQHWIQGEPPSGGPSQHSLSQALSGGTGAQAMCSCKHIAFVTFAQIGHLLFFFFRKGPRIAKTCGPLKLRSALTFL